jgi:hypothetical protein
MVNTYAFESMAYTWSSTHQPTQQLFISSQAGNQSIYIPAGGISDDFPFTFSASTTNVVETF